MKTYLLGTLSFILIANCSAPVSDTGLDAERSDSKLAKILDGNGSGYADLEGDIINYTYNQFGGFQLRFADKKLNWQGMSGYFRGVSQQVDPIVSKVADDVYFMSWPTPGEGSDNVVMNFKSMQVFAHLTQPNGQDMSIIEGVIDCRNGSTCAAPSDDLTPPPGILSLINTNMAEQNLPPMNEAFTQSMSPTGADKSAIEELVDLQIDYETSDEKLSLRIGAKESVLKRENGELERVESYSTKVAEGIYFVSWLSASGDNHIVFNKDTNSAIDLVSADGERTEVVSGISCIDQQDNCSVFTEPNLSKAPNFLVIIGDDMGKETLSCYDVGENQANTPNLDRLCQSGAVFENYWTQPFCSPTRATLLTGEYSFSNGVSSPVMPNLVYGIDQPDKLESAPKEVRFMQPELIRNFVPAEVVDASRGLRSGQTTLIHSLKQYNANYTAGAFGKWHLADPVNGALSHPKTTGFDTFSGYISGTLLSHFAWRHTDTDGNEVPATGYITTRIVDDASTWIQTQDAPWLAWVAFTAPKEPFHRPPTDLLSAQTANLEADLINQDNLDPYFQAAVEAMDTEIGRLIASIPVDDLDNTYIVFMSDNGTPAEIDPEPYSGARVKGTVFQGGVDMPMMISGPGITPGRYNNLTNSTDVLSSVLEMAGAPNVFQRGKDFGSHSVSFASAIRGETEDKPRQWIYADGSMMPSAPLHTAIRDETYKFVMIAGQEYLFNLAKDPYENSNLLDGELSAEAAVALETLKQNLQEIGAPAAAMIAEKKASATTTSSENSSGTDPSGTWSLSFSTPMGQQTARVELVQNGTTLKGRFDDAETNGQIIGSTVTFTGPMQTPMGEMILQFEGTIAGNEMSGEFKRIGGITPPPGAPPGGQAWRAARE